jgi:hypothetical protein
VIARANCGLGGRLHPLIAWAKLATLAGCARSHRRSGGGSGWRIARRASRAVIPGSRSECEGVVEGSPSGDSFETRSEKHWKSDRVIFWSTANAA